jgi:integrase/recombinase XerD
MNHPSRVRVTGPLERFAVGFAAELAKQGYGPNGAAQQLRLMAHLSRWLAEQRLDTASVAQTVTDRFLAARRAAGYVDLRSPRALQPLVGYLRTRGAVPPAGEVSPAGPVEELLCRYRRYLVAERGLVPASAETYAYAVRPFLESRLSSQGLELDELGAADLTAFVLAQQRRRGPGSAKQLVGPLRSLLDFLYLEGTIERRLSKALPGVAGWRLASLPKMISAAELRAILAACDRRTACGRRDFAIVATLARLGLRRCEVAHLRLQDIDWHAGELVVTGKGSRSERLPLPADVGEAIAAYLRRGRPETAQDRSVFVRFMAPHRALTPCAVGQVVVRAARRANLAHIHAHQLRHTAACQMMSAGASLQEVGQVLRHRHVQTTAIYAKVDRRALRQLARPWPGGLA